jgi:hypothetical protein
MAAHPIDPQKAANDSLEADRILADLRSLRQSILVAWNERAVILTREEQQELREEIKDTCEILNNLTG